MLALRTVFGAAAIGPVAVAGLIYLEWDTLVPVVGRGVNYVRFFNAPKGTLTTERHSHSAAQNMQFVAVPAMPVKVVATVTDSKHWPSYNRTLTSERFSELNQITKANAGELSVLCTYDTEQYTGFNTGLLEIEGALVFSTEYDIFSINPNTCQQNWRVHEDYTPATPLGVSRGPAFFEQMLFRGTQDGRVLAYDFKTGKRLWETRIADPKRGESTPAAPIAWNGLVFIGNAGGDLKGVKGRMYALDAKTGEIIWEFYLVPKSPGDMERGPQAPSPLNDSTWSTPPGQPITGGATWTSYTLDPRTGVLYVPAGNPAPNFAPSQRGGENLYSDSIVELDAKTGAFKGHFKIVPKDWHDWDVSAAPVVTSIASGKKVLFEAPKDGHLYAFDLSSRTQIFRVPVTKIDNADTPFEPGNAVHYCPGSAGGATWNGPAYDPQNNLVMVGEVQWCATVTVQPKEAVEKVVEGKPWSGMDTVNLVHIWGKADPLFDWAGWVYAVDAETGAWRWRVKSNYPVQSGVTPTAGGVVFFGDMGGNFYALDADTGDKLWGQKIGGAIGGGVITYESEGQQLVAVATGLIGVLWPSEQTTAKVSILGIKPK
jgi:alcohol dehydrogenase (cytochrome c)